MNKQYFTDCKNLDEAKQLYKKLAFQLHPDTSGRDSTAEFQELQNQFQNFKPNSSNEKFQGEFEAWNAKEYAHIIEALMQIPNIEIEVCGSWIWLSGDTKPVKELIKEIETGDSMKRGFSRDKKKWFFVRKDIRNIKRLWTLIKLKTYTDTRAEKQAAEKACKKLDFKKS